MAPFLLGAMSNERTNGRRCVPAARRRRRARGRPREDARGYFVPVFREEYMGSVVVVKVRF